MLHVCFKLTVDISEDIAVIFELIEDLEDLFEFVIVVHFSTE
jgi:hypothetical protein